MPYIDLPVLDGVAAMADNAKRPWGSNWTRYQMRLRDGQDKDAHERSSP